MSYQPATGSITERATMKKIASIACPLFLSLLIMLPDTGTAKTVKGVDFPETVTIDGVSCTLVGVGIRKKLIINVYLGALYLEKPTTNDTQVIASDQTKRIEMHFLYKDVRADQLVEAWNEGFQKNPPDKIPALKATIDRFNGFFAVPMKSGDTMAITYHPGKGTEVIIKGKTAGIIEGRDFMEVLFSIWFGQYPPSDGLKEGMLGK